MVLKSSLELSVDSVKYGVKKTVSFFSAQCQRSWSCLLHETTTWGRCWSHTSDGNSVSFHSVSQVSDSYGSLQIKVYFLTFQMIHCHFPQNGQSFWYYDCDCSSLHNYGWNCFIKSSFELPQSIYYIYKRKVNPIIYHIKSCHIKLCSTFDYRS